ncbi:MAG TPA: toll/interleukin-1 receptor domain-containing protein [Chondromyces sp.]|nr:toll/interleukin-1 receptor domain-containing protein [Chondromyces sp.]
MALFNLNELRSELRTKNFSWDARSLENLTEYAERKLNEQAKNFASYKSYDVFLSHSVKDSAAILRLSRILEDYGLKVYVDWIVDNQLDRSRVTTETAKIIRERLKSSKCFLMALTSNSAQSSWVQWELGLGDGQKNGKVAIVPLVTGEESNPNFFRQEYLGLYPYLDHVAGTIYVNGKRYVNLKEWLRQSNPLEQILYS